MSVPRKLSLGGGVLPPLPGAPIISAGSLQEEIKRTFRRGLGTKKAVAKWKRSNATNNTVAAAQQSAAAVPREEEEDKCAKLDVASVILDAGGLAALPMVAEPSDNEEKKERKKISHKDTKSDSIVGATDTVAVTAASIASATTANAIAAVTATVTSETSTLLRLPADVSASRLAQSDVLVNTSGLETVGVTKEAAQASEKTEVAEVTFHDLQDQGKPPPNVQTDVVKPKVELDGVNVPGLSKKSPENASNKICQDTLPRASSAHSKALRGSSSAGATTTTQSVAAKSSSPEKLHSIESRPQPQVEASGNKTSSPSTGSDDEKLNTRSRNLSPSCPSLLEAIIDEIAPLESPVEETADSLKKELWSAKYGVAQMVTETAKAVHKISKGTRPVIHLHHPTIMGEQGTAGRGRGRHKDKSEMLVDEHQVTLDERHSLFLKSDSDKRRRSSTEDYTWTPAKFKNAGQCNRHAKCHCYLFSLDTIGFYALS